MKATELRIGNFVKSVNFSISRVVEISALGRIEYVHYGIPDSEIGVWKDEEVEPIPLTEEWLLKFGFALSPAPYSGEKAYYIKEDADKIIWCAGELFKILPDGFIRITSANYAPYEPTTQYVHQLQNLYFALTGTELTL